MSETKDMDSPVTRRELHDALDIWGGALNSQIDSKIDRLDKKIDQVDKKIDFVAGQITHDIITQVKAALKLLEDRLMGELRGQVGGASDALETRFVAFEDHYKDLPDRVSKLEAEVFGPSPKRKRRAAR